MFTRNFTIIDVETTGGSPAAHRVIEIGILRVEHGEVMQKFKSLVNPGQPIPEFISGFTGISERMIKNAPAFEEIAEEIFPLFEDAIFVAHNCSFDYGFMRSEFARIGWGLTAPTLCTVRLSRALYPQYRRHNLDALVDRFDLKCKRRHRAFDDAKVLWDFLQLIEQQFPAEQVAAALERTMKKIPPKQQQKMPKIAEPEISYQPFDF